MIIPNCHIYYYNWYYRLTCRQAPSCAWLEYVNLLIRLVTTWYVFSIAVYNIIAWNVCCVCTNTSMNLLYFIILNVTALPISMNQKTLVISLSWLSAVLALLTWLYVLRRCFLLLDFFAVLQKVGNLLLSCYCLLVRLVFHL